MTYATGGGSGGGGAGVTDHSDLTGLEGDDHPYVKKAGDTMTAALVLAGNAGAALEATPLQQVQTLIAALADSAPATLDTLNELAAALGDDPNFATTLTAALAAKVPLAGGTMTGDLVLPGDPDADLKAAPKQYVDDRATYLRCALQALTDKTTWSGTSGEQWGTEEATFDNALLPATANVTVRARLAGSCFNWTSNGALAVWVEISLDGGATWSTGEEQRLKDGSGNATARLPANPAHQVTGTVTGDIQARAMASQATGSGASYDLLEGVLYLDVIVPFS